MHPVLASFGPITIYSYGFMISLGFIAGIALAYRLAKSAGISPDRVVDVSLTAIVFSIIGARVFYVIFFWRELKSPAEAFMLWQGGLVFYGGVIFAVLGILLAARIFKLNPLDLLDIASPVTALGYAIGRIGCFLNGCCYGVECSLPWAVRFPGVEGLRHPTQLYESMAGLLMFGLFLFLFRRRRFPGEVFSAALFTYSLYRFFMEFIRTSPPVYGLTEAQWGSIALCFAAAVIYGILYFRRRPR